MIEPFCSCSGQVQLGVQQVDGLKEGLPPATFVRLLSEGLVGLKEVLDTNAMAAQFGWTMDRNRVLQLLTLCFWRKSYLPIAYSIYPRISISTQHNCLDSGRVIEVKKRRAGLPRRESQTQRLHES